MSVSMYLLPSIIQHNILTQCVHVAVCVQIKTIVSTTKIRFGHLTLHLRPRVFDSCLPPEVGGIVQVLCTGL